MSSPYSPLSSPNSWLMPCKRTRTKSTKVWIRFLKNPSSLLETGTHGLPPSLSSPSLPPSFSPSFSVYHLTTGHYSRNFASYLASLLSLSTQWGCGRRATGRRNSQTVAVSIWVHQTPDGLSCSSILLLAPSLVLPPHLRDRWERERESVCVCLKFTL